MDDVTFQKNMSDLLKFERYYSLILEKQRTRWSKYLAFHPTIARDKELRLLVRKGIPPEMRGSIWQILCDTQSKRSQHDANYYSNLLSRANENGVGAANDIEKDLHRTFPTHSVYGTHKGVSILRSVLLAYSIRNPTVGYCQSMNFICAMLLLFMEEEDAFWMLACIVEDLTQVNGHYYYQADLVGARIDELVFKEIVKDRLPRINKKFDELEMAIEPLTINWFLCVFVNSVPLETTLRIWDVFFYDGSRALFRAGLALLRINEHLILQAQNSVQLMTFLKAFTRSALDCEVFIKACYEPFSMGTFSKHRIDEMRFEFMHHFGLQPTAQVFMASEDEVSKREEFIETGHKLVLEDITESESSEEIIYQNDRRIDMDAMDKKANSSPKLSPLFDQDSEPLLSEENSSTDIAHVDSKFADRFVGLQFLMSRLSFETNSLDCLSSPSERKISLNFSQGSSHRRRNSSLL